MIKMREATGDLTLSSGDTMNANNSRPLLQRFLAGRRSERFVNKCKKPIIGVKFDCTHPNTSTRSDSSGSGVDRGDSRSDVGASLKKQAQSPATSTPAPSCSQYRISHTPRFVMAALANLVDRNRSLSPRRSTNGRKHSAPSPTSLAENDARHKPSSRPLTPTIVTFTPHSPSITTSVLNAAISPLSSPTIRVKSASKQSLVHQTDVPPAAAAASSSIASTQDHDTCTRDFSSLLSLTTNKHNPSSQSSPSINTLLPLSNLFIAPHQQQTPQNNLSRDQCVYSSVQVVRLFDSFVALIRNARQPFSSPSSSNCHDCEVIAQHGRTSLEISIRPSDDCNQMNNHPPNIVVTSEGESSTNTLHSCRTAPTNGSFD
ncbi:unnamed protein product [Anisakis simplex]|uniref:Uncharacterized protein n=1 Tax=Anisakis simplex TaxID=6269 RepID=A0A0M3K773_ANISI|nr:unnamed protein product [Anisakis simplex]